MIAYFTKGTNIHEAVALQGNRELKKIISGLYPKDVVSLSGILDGSDSDSDHYRFLLSDGKPGCFFTVNGRGTDIIVVAGSVKHTRGKDEGVILNMISVYTYTKNNKKMRCFREFGLLPNCAANDKKSLKISAEHTRYLMRYLSRLKDLKDITEKIAASIRNNYMTRDWSSPKDIRNLITESVLLRNNDSNLLDIFRRFKELHSYLGHDPTLSDGKPGKYFVKDCVDSFGNKVKVLCFSFSDRNKTKGKTELHGLTNFFRDHIVIVMIRDGSKIWSATTRFIGFGADAKDMAARKLSSRFTRDFITKLSKYGKPSDMEAELLDAFYKNVNKVWGKDRIV